MHGLGHFDEESNESERTSHFFTTSKCFDDEVSKISPGKSTIMQEGKSLQKRNW